MIPIHKRMSQAKSPNMCVCVLWFRERECLVPLKCGEKSQRERESERVTLWLPFVCWQNWPNCQCLTKWMLMTMSSIFHVGMVTAFVFLLINLIGFLSFWVPSLWGFLSFHGRYSMLINVGRMKGSRAKGPNNIIWQNT